MEVRGNATESSSQVGREAPLPPLSRSPGLVTQLLQLAQQPADLVEAVRFEPGFDLVRLGRLGLNLFGRLAAVRRRAVLASESSVHGGARCSICSY